MQTYVDNPHLINGTKYDLRLHFLVTSVKPLRIYLHDEGFVRFATNQYRTDTTDIFTHITNTGLNLRNPLFVYKSWGIVKLKEHFMNEGLNFDKVWSDIEELVVKSVIASEHHLLKQYETYSRGSSYNFFNFHGIDIMLDENLKPWLMEINGATGLTSPSGRARDLNLYLATEMLNIARYHIPAQLSIEEESRILQSLNITDIDRLSYDKRLYSTRTVSHDKKKRKAAMKAASESLESPMRENFLESLLMQLLPSEVRELIRSEDELAQLKHFSRIYPRKDMAKYNKFFKSPRYFNILMEAWENKFAGAREEGIALLRSICETKYHLKGT